MKALITLIIIFIPFMAFIGAIVLIAILTFPIKPHIETEEERKKRWEDDWTEAVTGVRP